MFPPVAVDEEKVVKVESNVGVPWADMFLRLTRRNTTRGFLKAMSGLPFWSLHLWQATTCT
jgi:hypothetical protein